ncbi:MAG: RNA polymerase sigma factor [Rhodospirillales bacterium]|nr:RNA polymerase sigma factor [Rhodospirillales bacterium]
MTQDHEQHWKDLAIAAQGGDKASYVRLLKEIAPYIRKIVLAGLANPDGADDITQEVLISIHKSLGTYSGDRAFKPWLHAIIHYRKTDYLRQHYARRGNLSVPVETQIDLADPVTSPEVLLEYRNVENEIARLPRKQQTVFRLMKIEGFTAQEVAERTGMSVSAVKVSAHRTLEKLKEKMG